MVKYAWVPFGNFWSYTESSIMSIKISIAFIFIVFNKKILGEILRLEVRYLLYQSMNLFSIHIHWTKVLLFHHSYLHIHMDHILDFHHRSHPIIGECSDVPVLSTSPLIELNSKSEEIPSPAFVIRRDLNFPWRIKRTISNSQFKIITFSKNSVIIGYIIFISFK